MNRTIQKSLQAMLFSLCFLGSFGANANVWIHDVKVVQLGTYQDNTWHFVWLSSGVVPSCQQQSPGTPVIGFDEAKPGGKSLVSILTAAVIAKATVDVQVSGCNIVEVYLK